MLKNISCLLLLMSLYACKEKNGHHVMPETAAVTPQEEILHSAFVPKGYELIWNDEFSGTELDLAKWCFPSYKYRGAATMNSPGTVVCKDDMLHLTTLWQDKQIHASYISTRDRFEQKYGYYEARIKFQKLQGHHGAFWLQSRSLTDGVNDPAKYGTEMDIIEWFGDGRIKGWAGMHVYYHSLGNNGQERRMRNLSWPAFHLMGGPLEGKEDEVLENLSERFRVYGLLWTEKGCYFSCDGVEIMAEESIVSKVPQFIVLSLLCENWERQRMQVEKLPDSMQVDYVRVYASDLQANKPD